MKIQKQFTFIKIFNKLHETYEQAIENFIAIIHCYRTHLGSINVPAV
jgi:hypothetical protein